MSKRFNELKKAQPVFLEGLENETNIQAGFVCELTLNRSDISGKCTALVAARNFYRLYVNGVLTAHGPARAPKGYLRVDEIDLSDRVKEGKNIFAFEVTSYGDPFGTYANDTVLGKGLLRAAVLASSASIYSSPGTLSGIRLYQRKQYAERISHCRAMAENYDLDEVYTLWRTDRSLCRDRVAAVDDRSVLLERGSALPSLDKYCKAKPVLAGRAVIDESISFEDAWFEKNISYYSGLEERPRKDRIKTREEPFVFPENCRISEDGTVTVDVAKGGSCFAEYDLGRQEVGFVEIDFETEGPGIADIVHLESHGVYGDSDEISGGANPVTRIHVKGGRVSFISMEPALGRYFKVYFRGCGPVKLFELGIRGYTAPEPLASFLCSDDNVNRLFNAAALTYRLNTLDIFMDCPERERGGWLCDSYWTGRAEKMLTGGHRVERDFLENFLLTDPEAMWHGFFPECYPGDKPSYSECAGITTWSFWLMLELCEYANETDDLEFIEKHRKRVEAFVEGAAGLTGPSGLFENLPWVFIDWSYSNDPDFYNPVSTAANALGSKMFESLGKLYGRQDWITLGRKMKSKLKKAILGCGAQGKGPAYIPDGFGVAEGGKLVPKGRTTESASYLTVWAGIIDKKEAPLTLFNIVKAMGPCPEFSPDPNIGRAGLFIGLQYRFDMMAKLGEYGTLFKELNAFYGGQLKEGPGTLWENPAVRTSSYCHGFTSFAAVQLFRDILGIGIPDEKNGTVKIEPHPCGLRWAKGSVMTSKGLITLSWVEKDGKLEIKKGLPRGFRAEKN